MAIPEILVGMRTVLKNVFLRKDTVKYPEVRRMPFPRSSRDSRTSRRKSKFGWRFPSAKWTRPLRRTRFPR